MGNYCLQWGVPLKFYSGVNSTHEETPNIIPTGQ